MKPPILGYALAILTSVTAANAATHEPDVEAAGQHFDAGRAHVRAGHCDLAIEEFRASIEAAPNVGAWLNLGDCLETLNRFQQAYEAQRAGQTLAAEKRDERVAVARASAERIQAKVLTLIINTPTDARDVQLSVDDTIVPRERWSAILVSPNERHTVVARAPGVLPFSREIAGRAGEAVPVPIVFASAAGPERSVPVPREETSWLRPGGVITAGVGAAALAGAGVFGALASSARSDLADTITNNPRCNGSYPNETCDASVRPVLDPLQDRMQGRATAATVFFVTGVALLAGGLAMIIFAPSSRPKSARAFSPSFVW